MKYFADCSNIQELKQMYRKLCFKLHPDIAGAEKEEEFKKMNKEYESLLIKLANVENLSNAEKEETYNCKDDRFAEIIQKIVTFSEMKIEIIGIWIWCFNSYLYKDQLKELGFWYSGSKKAWVYSGSEKSRYRGHYTLSKLHEKWNCEDIETKKTEKIA